MKLYHRDKAKEYRRIMLDVLEVCPRRFRENILQDMAYIREDGDFMAEHFGHLHSAGLQFFYRLRNSRSFRHATPYQSRLLQSIVDRLEEACRYDTGQAFRFETAEERQASRKEISECIRRQIEWSERHPFLSALLMKYFATVGITTLLVMLIIASLIMFVFGGKHPDLSF
ncbi:hypothetical protein [Pantoea dispersa]|uniref:hypothetical protein n=1 Tax=Pantoea dispersa TaxID=59814 RepID=UPI0039B69B6D